MEKEKWINEILDSTKGMQKAEPSSFLFEQVTERIKSGKEMIRANPALKWGLAASMLVIIIFNAISILKSNSGNDRANVGKVNSNESQLNNATIYNY